jgi:hypothetical protein
MANNNYILYVTSDANFQTKSMLIPFAEFIKARSEDYELLVTASIRNYKFNIDGEEHIIDNLLCQNYIWTKNMGVAEKHSHTETCNQLFAYADGFDGHFNLEDKAWYDSAMINLCKGFNHIKNYTKLKQMTHHKGKPVNIINSFLLLELKDGTLEMPTCDTVDEMYEMYYSPD